MEIKPNTGLIKAESSSRSGDPLSRLEPGQRLSATVVERLSGKNLWRLNIQGQHVRAESTTKLAPGQLLRLETVKVGGKPELRIVLPELPQETIAKTLRTNLPIQRNITELADLLLADSKPSLGNSTTTKSIAKLAKEVLRSLPSQSNLASADGLKKALQGSGIFLEAKLANLAANSQGVIGSDLKASILRLVAALRNQTAPPNRSRTAPKLDQSSIEAGAANKPGGKLNQVDGKSHPANPGDPADNFHKMENLLKTAEGAVAKIMTEQIASLPKGETQNQTWSLDLPHLTDNQPASIGIKIRREQSQNPDNEDPAWSVTLELEPDGIGTIQSKITLRGGQVNTYFWSKNSETSNLINTNLDDLRQRFLSVGLSAGELSAFNAEPPENFSVSIVDAAHDILSERV